MSPNPFALRKTLADQPLKRVSASVAFLWRGWSSTGVMSARARAGLSPTRGSEIIYKANREDSPGQATAPCAPSQACAPRLFLEGSSDVKVRLKTGVYPVPIKYILAMGEILGDSFNW